MRSAWLTTAIKIGDATKAILLKCRTFPEEEFGEQNSMVDSGHIGVEPMLLALSMELALKAWYVFDHDDQKSSDRTVWSSCLRA